MRRSFHATNSLFIGFTFLVIADNAAASTCPQPTLINAVVDTTKFPKESISTQYKSDTIFYYKCKSGYSFKGGAERHKVRCSEQGVWEPSPFICYDSCNNECAINAYCKEGKCHCDNLHTGQLCRDRICEIPKYFPNGVVKVLNPEHILSDETLTEGARITFVCNYGYSITKGSVVHTCTEHGWDWQNLPVCEKNVCSRLPFSHGNPLPDQLQYFAGSKINFQCFPGYMLGGSSTLFCNLDGTWSNMWPTCVELTCPLVLLPHGIIDPPNVGQDGRYPVNTALTLNCMKGYAYVGESQKIRCQPPPVVKWSSEPGLCISDYKFHRQCMLEGKVMRFVDGKKICIFANKGTDSLAPTTVKSAKKTEKPLTIVTSTAGGLLLLLLVVLTSVLCRRRRNAQNRRGSGGGRSGHRRLNNDDDDRMSFVYYSNDVHVVLPSYDEAMQARRINNPPPYLPVEDSNGGAAATTTATPAAVAASTAAVSTTSFVNDNGGGANLYETIDEIRSTVNQVRNSLTTSTGRGGSTNTANRTEDVNADSPHVPPPPPPPPVSNDTENNDNVIGAPPLRYGLYDGPSDEPIYASVQRILSNSLILAANGQATNSSTTNTSPPPPPPDRAFDDDAYDDQKDTVETISLDSSDGDGANSDTEPLL